MWSLFNCYLSGRHEYGMWCEPGNIFLRCVHCGRRSSGWDVEEKPNTPIVEHATPRVSARPTAIVTAPPPVVHARVLPFGRAAAQ
jgi:hypothetical protein